MSLAAKGKGWEERWPKREGCVNHMTIERKDRKVEGAQGGATLAYYVPKHATLHASVSYSIYALHLFAEAGNRSAFSPAREYLNRVGHAWPHNVHIAGRRSTPVR